MKKLHLSDLPTIKKIKCRSNDIACLCFGQVYEVTRHDGDAFINCSQGPHFLGVHLANDENFIPEFEVIE